MPAHRLSPSGTGSFPPLHTQTRTLFFDPSAQICSV